VSGALRSAGVDVDVFRVEGEPEVETVRAGVAQARLGARDMVVAIGGGSAIDTGKAIAVLAPHHTDLSDHLEVIGRGRALPGPGLPFVAVPTTAGTGSEVTRNAVLASPAHRVKVSLRSPHMLARLAVVDPELTLGLPPPVTAATGLDAITQLVEPYLSARANAFTDALCIEALPRAARALPVAFRDGTNMAAREDMALASLFSGLALANAGLGAVHGFAGTIGGMFPAPHGAICAALLPHVLEGNLRAIETRQPSHPTRPRFDAVARVLTGTPSASARDGVEWLTSLVGELGIPRLGAYGLTDADVPAVVAQASQSSSMKANPIALTTEELAAMLGAAV
jgi:alcohol dehydrogenase class IV